MTCPAARSQQSSCHASLWSRCGCRALRSVVPKVNWILPGTQPRDRSDARVTRAGYCCDQAAGHVMLAHFYSNFSFFGGWYHASATTLILWVEADKFFEIIRYWNFSGWGRFWGAQVWLRILNFLLIMIFLGELRIDDCRVEIFCFIKSWGY